ncbi:MAG: RICIN domain-containing protein, partial [Eggerthellaceae bacterium]|nr:RICIN domain-containing protein [Eggerthellaceae bacterium]
TLKAGTDYTVSYSNNTKVGTATVKVTGKGNYTGTKSATFNIVDVKPAWSGATSMPTSSTADYKVTNGGRIRVEVNGSFTGSDSIVSLADIDATTIRVTAKKAGTTTLYLFDRNGKQVASKKVKVFPLTGSYELQSAVDSGYVLDIRGSSKANSARMIVWPRTNGKNQRYQFVAQKDGTYGIRCVHSGKFVDVQGGGTRKSQPVIQYTWHGGKNQRWRITVDERNLVSFVSAKSGMVFDIQGGKVTKRARMIQYPANGCANQKWVLNKKN